MKNQYGPLVAAVLLTLLLPVCTPSVASEDDHDLKAISERMRQTSHQIQEDIRKARARLDAQEAQEAAERKKSATRGRRPPEKEVARLDAIKKEKERLAEEVAQAQARKEAADHEAKVELERLAALKAQRAMEEKAARTQADRVLAAKAAATKEQAMKKEAEQAEADRGHLGRELRFGVDM